MMLSLTTLAIIEALAILSDFWSPFIIASTFLIKLENYGCSKSTKHTSGITFNLLNASIIPKKQVYRGSLATSLAPHPQSCGINPMVPPTNKIGLLYTLLFKNKTSLKTTNMNQI
ncbi:hypothetical protein [Spiroplasma endosymbiont of Polydrusus pterygomalis]|uniref:hypothetical protein n=1 Tax=Spiroplasma endosymbiont of Polydrusus pterygomalis TaxID=3139327 RepID=UPI003CCAB726